MKVLSAQDYWKEVRDCASSIIARSATMPDDELANSMRDIIMEGLCHELSEHHQWTTYTYYQQCILLHTDNPEAYFELYEDITVEHTGEFFTKVATAAFESDIWDTISLMISNPTLLSA